MKQTIEIEVPEGKKAVLKDGKVVFEDIKPELPKTWEEFCRKYPIKEGEAYIESASIIEHIDSTTARLKKSDRNLLPSKEAAEAHLAHMQLHQLRDCYRQGWVPDWKDKTQTKYYIIPNYRGNNYMRFLTFKSKEIANEFLNNFEDLIRKAGDLI